MKSESESIKEYTEVDGTRVRIRTITTRTNPIQSNRNVGIVSCTNEEPKKFLKSEQSTSTANEQFQNEFLNAHNKYRALHGVPSMTLNKDLNAYAQEWANHLAQTGSLNHRSPNKYGENLFMKGGTNLTITGDEAVKNWYNEIKDYSYYGNEPPMSQFSKYGHFTQVIWKGSTELGVGLAIKNNSAYVVGNYKPAGNIIGSFKTNVLPKK